MKKLIVVLFTATAAFALEVLPSQVELSGIEGRQQLLALTKDGGYDEDATRAVEWSSSNPAVATVDANGVVKAAADGEAVITARGKGQSASVKIHVRDTGAAWQWSFRNHVIPVMTKQGCNQGACHGALAGKNGFKLTLRGYDPDVDYDTLTRQSVGRRVSTADPASSLMLLKPSLKVAHGGGLRLKPDSLEYRIIAEWIASGAPLAEKEKEVTGLEVYPKHAIVKTGHEQQLVVRAKYSDGSVADVTRWVKYASANEGTATVDDNGLVKVTGPGEAAITLWYSSRVLYATVTCPYDNAVSPQVYTEWKRSNFVDEQVIRKLENLRIAPSRDADDATFLRRAYVDAAGILPTPEETEQFLADKRPDKRARVIDSLLERDEYIDYWAYKWSDLLLVSSRKLRSESMWSFYNWIRASVKTNKPWDQFAREIFTGTGSTITNGALNYYVVHKDTTDLAENATQAFLGQRLTCARCHNHPLEKWTQKQYFQFANLFARVGLKDGDRPGETVVYAKMQGDINHPRLLRPLPPTPLDGQPLAIDSTEDRRIAFAKWLTSPSNEYFARNIVNRVWGNFMGRGLCHPVDDVRATNPPSNEELFAALVKDFVDHRFDIKHLIRTIMNSHAYQLSAEANPTNQNDDRFYSRYIVKRLPAEVLLDAMSEVTGVTSDFPGYPAGTKALQLPDTQVQSQFLTVFGRPKRILCDAAERSAEPTIAQALHIVNGDTLNRKLADPNGNVELFLRLGLSDTRIVEHLTLAALSRYPTDDEKTRIVALISATRGHGGTPEAERRSREQAIEDIAWAMLTSKEFLFNH